MTALILDYNEVKMEEMFRDNLRRKTHGKINYWTLEVTAFEEREYIGNFTGIQTFAFMEGIILEGTDVRSNKTVWLSSGLTLDV